MSVENIKNNTTALDEILAVIKEKGNATAEQMAEFKNILDNQSKETSKQLEQQKKDVETEIEKKMASLVEKMTGAFEKGAFGKQATEQPRFKNFGEFLHKVKGKQPEIKDLSEVSGDGGGYLVPEQYANEVLRIALDGNVVRNSGARVIPMMSNIIRIPALQMSSNASGSIYGGVSAYWGAENTSMTESQPKFDRITLELKKLYGYCEDPNELEEDAMVSMSALLTQMFADVLAFEEDITFISGNGVNQPLGVLNAPCLTTVSRTSASEIRTLDVINMMARFNGSLDRAVFNLNQTVMPYIHQLRDANDNYIFHPGNAGNISGKAPGTLYGIPLRISEKFSAVGTTGDLLLADWGYYLIGDKGGLRIDYSQHFKFQTDQMAYRIVRRVDGQPWLKTAITPRNGGSTLSPFVAVT